MTAWAFFYNAMPELTEPFKTYLIVIYNIF